MTLQAPVTAPRSAYAVLIFFLCFVFSYIDRQIVSILVQPLKAALHLSDMQIGLLQGLAFTVCYATAGVFVARLVDRSNRVRLIAVCVAIWAISTAMCATAHSFGELLVWRAGTAIAEAGLSPAALSIFSDLFVPRKVSRATSVFMLGPYIGGGVALLGGGALLDWTAHSGRTQAIAGYAFEPWQLAFVVVGLPGLFLAALVAATIREPSRRGDAGRAGGSDDVPSMMVVLREITVTHRFCVPYFLGYTALILLFYAYSAWFPTLLIRQFGLAPGEVGRMAGPAYMLGGMAGVISAGFLVRRATDASALEKALRIAMFAAFALIPAALAAPLSSALTGALIAYGLCAFTASIVMALAPVPVQVALPNRMRGRAIAILVFLTNTVAGGLGPLAVGAIADRLALGARGLAIGLATVGATAALASAVLYFAATRMVSGGLSGARQPKRTSELPGAEG
ncbi:MFS transporter [Trinickia diaoshuihuensis]|uniref:MFS transporter n=1 Tax=Trinickia diaoshuihuensis TaxID=2292265 RepID=UPI001F079B21|nr:MFS transporter [Trinickia diaoshuihuensis]